MLPEIKLGMVVKVIGAEDGMHRPYLVSKCKTDYILAHPLYPMKLPYTAFQIPWSRIVEVLAENLAQYMTKMRNKSYTGTVCQSANSHETALVTECCSDGTVKGFKLDDGSPWETNWPIKLADSVHEYCKKQVAKHP